jgi:sialic acid synthase SpsE
MRSINPDANVVSDELGAYIIPEVGHNHQGNLARAIDLTELYPTDIADHALTKLKQSNIRTVIICGARYKCIWKSNPQRLVLTATYEQPHTHLVGKLWIGYV